MGERDRVRVVFADGSRAQAHNLDELRERWLMRAGGEEKLPHYAFTDYTSSVPMEQLNEWREELIRRKEQVELGLSRFREIAQEEGGLRGVDHKARRVLIAENHYVHAVIRCIKEEIRKTNIREHEHDRPSGILRMAEDTGQPEAFYIAKLRGLVIGLSKRGVELTEEEWGLVKASGEFLKNISDKRDFSP